MPDGPLNSERLPWSYLVNLRMERAFPLRSGVDLTAFLWVQNLFDTQNVLHVWPFTGLPDEDGFLSSAQGAQYLTNVVPVTETAYRHRTRLLHNVGIPRLVRLGLRVDF